LNSAGTANCASGKRTGGWKRRHEAADYVRETKSQHFLRRINRGTHRYKKIVTIYYGVSFTRLAKYSIQKILMHRKSYKEEKYSRYYILHEINPQN